MSKVKEEIGVESLQDGNDCYSDPMSPAADSNLIPKNEIKEELYDFYESDNSLQFDDLLIKPEKVDNSDLELSSKRKESEDEIEQRHEIQEASKTLKCAACLSKFSDKATLTRHVDSRCLESLCRPCNVVLERLDSRTKASAAAVFSCPLCNIGFTSKFRQDRHQRLSCRRRCFNEPLKTTLTKKVPAAIEQSAKLNESEGESRKRFKCSDCKYSTDLRNNFKDHRVTHTGERRYPCTKCEYKAALKSTLTRHLLTHGDVKPFACAECNYRCVQKYNLTTHIMRFHMGEKPCKCTQCDYASSHRSHLVDHVRSKHTGERFPCSMCEYKATTKGHLSRHLLTHDDVNFRCLRKASLSRHNMRLHVGEKPCKCTQCDYASSHRSHLVDHVRSKHTGERFPCSMCEYKATTKGHLSRHLLTHGDVNFRCLRKASLSRHNMRLHVAEKRFKCTQCDHASNDSDHLVKHVCSKHTEERRFPCNVCEYKAITKSNLTSHLVTHGDVKPFACTLCSYRSVRKTHLTRHILLHTGERPYKCTVCDFASNDSRSLVKHLRSRHNKEQTFGSRGRQAREMAIRKRFKCSDCKYSTEKTSTFKQHLATHTGERRFQCGQCDHKAAQKVTLTRHLVTHGDVKPFACAECNYRSFHKCSLTTHMRLHTGEKPFKCTQCDYASNRSNTLARHLRTKHTMGRPYGCTQCEFTCVQRSRLASHMLKHGADKKLS